VFRFKDGEFELGRKTFIAGILNVTPDSFSDGNRFLDGEKALRRALEIIDQGVDILDVGGESTRPGAAAVSPDEELGRIIPVIREIRRMRPDAVISVDTYKSSVADEALRSGAHIINDVSGLRASADMAETVARHGAGLIIMHSRGTSSSMASLANYRDLISEIIEEIMGSVACALKKGVSRHNVAIDPGLGFAKNAGQNLGIVRNIAKFKEPGYPVYVGPSRKSFISAALGGRETGQRLWGTAAVVALFAASGVDFIRIHDTEEMADVIKMTDSIFRPKRVAK
jgi:dihydropteroate synthase